MTDERVSRRQALKKAGIVGAAGVAGAAGLAAFPTTVARADGSGDSLVGTWLGTATLSGIPSFGTLLCFAVGGTLVHSTAVDLQSSQLSTPSYGAWQRTGSDKYAAKFFFFTFDAQTNPSGSGEVAEKLTVDGNQLHGTIAVTVFDINGVVVFTDTGTLSAKRVVAV